MSPSGQSRPFDRASLTSGLPRLADFLRIIRHVSKVPEKLCCAIDECKNRLDADVEADIPFSPTSDTTAAILRAKDIAASSVTCSTPLLALCGPDKITRPNRAVLPGPTLPRPPESDLKRLRSHGRGRFLRGTFVIPGAGPGGASRRVTALAEQCAASAFR